MRQAIVQFSRAQICSVVSTALDFLITALLFRLWQQVVFSTATGTIAGGVFNCFLNYKWAFRGTKRSKRSVIIRYLWVWVVSVLANTFGTKYLVKAVALWYGPSLTTVIAAKAVVAVLVAILWNFLMHKYYVYKK